MGMRLGWPPVATTMFFTCAHMPGERGNAHNRAHTVDQQEACQRWSNNKLFKDKLFKSL
jgi:hypothetical protein